MLPWIRDQAVSIAGIVIGIVIGGSIVVSIGITILNNSDPLNLNSLRCTQVTETEWRCTIK